MTAGDQSSMRPRVAYLSYSSGEFDARSFRMARSAAAAGYDVTIYARLEPGHPDLEEGDGYRLLRVPADWRLAVPGLRGRARRRARAALAEAERLRAKPAKAVRPSASAVEPTLHPALEGPIETSPGRSELPSVGVDDQRRMHAGSHFLVKSLRRLARPIIAFPLRPMGWALALDDFATPADIWHGMWAGSLPALDRQRRRLGGWTIYDSRDVYMLARERPQLARPVRTLIGWLERRWARRMDRVLTVNEWAADLLVRQLGIPRPRVVMNCGEVLGHDAPTEPNRIRQAIGLDDATAVVLYQGQFITERGIEQAMDAILDVPRAVLVLLGYGPLEQTLREKLSAPPFLGKAYLLAAVPPADLLEWTASADVTVVPVQPTTLNHRYSTPQKLFESIAAGVPVVAADLPAMAEIVQSARVGLLCDSTSPSSIARALREVLAAPARERAAQRTHIRAVANEKYSWPAQARVLLAVYDELLRPATDRGQDFGVDG
jgi:glycosyltransferase involved in cell wall biosynthesis